MDIIKRMELETQTTLYTLDPIYLVNTTEGLRYNMLNNHVCNISPDKNIHLYTPIDKNKYISPELLENNKLPLRFHYKSVYYSLGCLIEFLLQEQNIIGTKIHSFILRCKNMKSTNRSLIL